MTRGRKIALSFVGAVLLLCGGGSFLLWHSLTSGPESLSAGIAAYRKAGLPWTAAELQPPVPAEQDGAPLLIEAFEGLDRLQAYSIEQLVAGDLDAGKTAQAATRLKLFTAPLDLVAQAIKRPHAVFPKDWDMGGFSLLPEVMTARNAIRLLCDRAIVEAITDDSSRCCADLQTAMKLSDRMGEEPAMMATLSQFNDRTTVYHAVERCATIVSGKLPAEKALAAALDAMSGTPSLVHAIRSEAYMDIATLRNYSLFESRSRAMNDDHSVVLPPIDERRLVRSGDPSGFKAEVFGGPALLAEAQLAEIERSDAGDPRRLAIDGKAAAIAITVHGGFRQSLSELLTQAVGQTSQMLLFNGGNLLLTDAAEAVATKALIEAEIMKTETGHFPHMISDLPTKWVDPCDGEPLRLLLGKGSIRIYSVGPNMKDDGGKTQYEVHFKEDFDVVAGDPLPQYESPAVGARKGSTQSGSKK